jgi:hypothetical protein
LYQLGAECFESAPGRNEYRWYLGTVDEEVSAKASRY